ncbi:MAG TPA: hypothetical protein VLF89_03175 [Candidatus Saccharimonadales bacterium]|nr:hypothetical protein [Candidatus Saccharimonadales bacterium]
MNEREFLQKLQARAKEQEDLMKGVPSPKLFFKISLWLGRHPWRMLIPLAFFVSLILRNIFGSSYTDFILLVFRKI